MAILLALLLTSPAPPAADPAPPQDDPSGPAQAESEKFDLALVRSEGLDAGSLRSELALRLPELDLRPHEAAGEIGERDAPYLYLEAQKSGPTTYRIAIIISDGRGYYDDVETGDAVAAERVVGSTIANLVFSIEQGSVDPDRDDATIPPSEEPTTPEPKPEPTQTEPEPEPQPPDAPRLEIGVGLGGGLATAVGPPRFADGHLGFGGGVGLELRTRGGFWAYADFRTIGRSHLEHRLTRLRGGLGAGYAWRSENLEIAMALGLAVEPWLVSSDSGLAPVSRNGTSGRPPLLSWALRLSPGYLIESQRPALKAMRIGPRIDLGSGFVVSDGVVVAGLETRDGQELFRIGGVEMYTGLELTMWFSRPSARNP